MSMKVLKNIICSIAVPFTSICNQSFIEGIFPDSMKIAKIKPLYKSGEKNVFTNYRPVSLLPQLSKVLEKLFNARLENFIDKHNILSDNQYGFRSNRSTSEALLELVEKITTAMDKKKYTLGVFIDLKKAFDTIDHELLIKKLEFYGVRGVALTWLASYLNNRKQYVDLNGEISAYLTVLCGVPQGSILGPKLFIIYINDICNVSKILDLILFADDTNIFYTGNNIVELCKQLCVELDKLNIWFAVNKLSLNVSKTNYMIFCKKRIPSDLKVCINSIDIDRVTQSKFLGVTVDEKLSWKEHIHRVNNKLCKSLAIMYKAKCKLNEKALQSIYYALFYPYMNYCLEVWGITNSSKLHCLNILQKRAIRLICNKGSRYHSNELFYKLRVVKFSDLVDIKVCSVIHKAKLNLLPNKLLQLLELETNDIHDTRCKTKFRQKFARTALKARCISIKGIVIYNKLHDNIKNCKSVRCFNKCFKYNVIERYKKIDMS